ncbi:TPA: DUF1983 domain-containing protein [Escherichia coli]|nr:DUF1983 domain-containing protein [Escherichia coli]
MAISTPIRGRKGGSSSSRTPTEQPDDLQSVAKAKILVALGEGEFAGQLTAKDIYLDGTPLENADGSQNFSGVAWEFRPGTQAQKYIQGIPGTENEISVGTEVSSTTGWTHTFTNTQLSAVRLRLKWPSLFKQEDDGDLVGYSINYAIDLQTDGGTWQTVLNTSVTGKTTSGYERSHRIDLPQAGSTWTVRLRKLTADANSAKIGDTMTLQSYTEVIDAKLRYPNTALLYIEFDSSQFNGSIPQISCEPRGRVIRVPDNGDGTFSITGAWHDPDKYARIDTGAIIDQRPVSVIPPGNQSPPANIVISSFSVVQQNISVETMRVSWDQAQNAIAYEAQWRRNDGNWVNVPRTSTTSFDVPGIYAGRYLVRVRAINAAEISSGWGYSEEKTLTGKVGNPPKPVGFIASENVVFGIELNWGFPANTDDTLKTEIQYSLTGTDGDAILLADVPYPQRKYQQMGLKAGQIFWYRAQLVDRTGNESGYTGWVRGQASIDVSDITDVILEDIKGSETFKDLIENAVDTNEKIAGMADDIKQANDELELQAQEIAKNAQDIGQVQTSVNELSSTVGDVSSSLSELEQTVATADTALGQRIDSISVSMDGMTGGVKNSAIAIIQGNLAQVAARKTLSASVAGNSAQLDRLDEVIVSEKEATARSLLSLQTDVNGNKASINSLNQTLSDYQQATATQINVITATVNGHTSAITTNAQAIANVNGELSAMYNIKVGVSSNGQYYAAGMGIGVENTPSGMQSQVIFLADRFAVTTAAGNSVALPFVIQNGQTFIRASFIQDGTIENAKIGNYIQSNNYAAGSAGWKLNKAGDAEFNNVTVRGVVYASGGSFTGEIQATSGKFKGTVEAQSFIGDIANMHTGTNVSRSSDGSLEKVITYTDSSSSGHARHVCVIANVKGNGAGLININGNESGSSVQDVERLIMHSAVVTGPNVTVRIKVSAQNGRGAFISSPTIIVSHGSGSFTD